MSSRMLSALKMTRKMSSGSRMGSAWCRLLVAVVLYCLVYMSKRMLLGSRCLEVTTIPFPSTRISGQMGGIEDMTIYTNKEKIIIDGYHWRVLTIVAGCD